MTTPTKRTRTPRSGEFERDMEQARLDAEAAELRAQGMTYRAIGAAMGIDPTTARDRVLRAIDAVPVEAVAELRARSGARIEMLMFEAFKILTAEHPKVDHGRKIEGVFDQGPRIAAIREMRLLDHEYRQLFGLDMPTKLDLTVTTEMEREIMALAQELGLQDQVESESVG